MVIGNEALSSVMPVSTEPKLLGMDLVRLGLERGKTAVEAVQVITAMVTRHGQGVFENDAGVRTYDNGFIVADPEEAYVIETAGHEWAVKRVQGALGISNVHSIGADWAALSRTAQRHAVESGLWDDDGERFDFAEAFSDYSPRSRGRGAQRRGRSCAVLAQADGTTDLHTMIGILRDHSASDDPEAAGYDRLPNAPSICMHHGENTGSNTAASLIADLCADGSRLPRVLVQPLLALPGAIPAGIHRRAHTFRALGRRRRACRRQPLVALSRPGEAHAARRGLQRGGGLHAEFSLVGDSRGPDSQRLRYRLTSPRGHGTTAATRPGPRC